MRFGGDIMESVTVSDVVQRTHSGIRHKQNYYAILAVIAIAVFEGFVVLNTSAAVMLTIHALLSFTGIVAGCFSIVRNENRLITHFRKAFESKGNHLPVKIETNRTCNICNSQFTEFPCPTCGRSDARIIIEVNEKIQISENITTVKANHFTTQNFLGMSFFVLIIGLQWVLSYVNGSVTSLIISALFAFVLFIPAHYMFLKSKFKDEEVLT